jgi:hypothetical protein
LSSILKHEEQVTWAKARHWWEEAATWIGPETVHNGKRAFSIP